MGISDNLTKYRGITHNGLVPHAGGEAILPAAYQLVGVWKGRSNGLLFKIQWSVYIVALYSYKK